MSAKNSVNKILLSILLSAICFAGPHSEANQASARETIKFTAVIYAFDEKYVIFDQAGRRIKLPRSLVSKQLLHGGQLVTLRLTDDQIEIFMHSIKDRKPASL